MAMEGPTPVSSLLHSSTIVVARLYLRSVLNLNLYLIMMIVGSLILVNNIILNDIKKMIAFSTATNLVFIGLLLSISLFRVVMLHICVHAFFKASAFMWSGVIIHSNGEQNSNYTFSLYIALCILILIGLPGMMPRISKELIMIEFGLIGIMLLIVAISYSKVFSSGLLSMESICIFLLPVGLSVMVMGGLLVMDVGVLVIMFILVFQFVVAFL